MRAHSPAQPQSATTGAFNSAGKRGVLGLYSQPDGKTPSEAHANLRPYHSFALTQDADAQVGNLIGAIG